MEDEKYEFTVFYLTKERQGLYIGNKLIKTVDEVQGKIKQLELFETEDYLKNDKEKIIDSFK